MYAYRIRILEGFIGLKDETLRISQNDDILDSPLKTLSRTQEKGQLSLMKDKVTPVTHYSIHQLFL